MRYLYRSWAMGFFNTFVQLKIEEGQDRHFVVQRGTSLGENIVLWVVTIVEHGFEYRIVFCFYPSTPTQAKVDTESSPYFTASFVCYINRT